MASISSLVLICSPVKSKTGACVMYITSTNVNESLLVVEGLCQIKWGLLLLPDLQWA